jgi:ABC-type lipoprotein export system ATPase subunit
MIKISNLTKQYGNEVIFRNLEFEAFKGKFTIIQGQSGSGKTTLLNIISTIDSVDNDAKLIIDKQNIHEFNEHQRAKFRATKIGFIFQSYALIPEFTIVENCTIPLTMMGISTKDAIIKAKEKIKEFIPEADDEFFKKTPMQLSGGQQQRVSIARALIHDPDIIIADEPTANLDENASKKVKEDLQKLSKTKCIIVVTHENDYRNYADILYEFKLDESKKSKSILKDPECLKN